jgi:hypothetical protein
MSIDSAITPQSQPIPLTNAITIGINPYLILRSEGRGHRPDIPEQSRSRPITRPSVERGGA